MVKESGNENSVAGSEMSHRCGRSCLGPLTFHCQSVGDMVRLSQGCLLAERREDTFRNGLVFSSRPVKVQERIRLPGHWAAPLHESYCQSGSELEFWVSCGGTIYVTSNNIRQHKLLTGVDLRQPLWAMIDIYGQTCSIFLLGSEKRGLFCTRRSCPAPERLTLPNVDNHFSLIPDASSLYGNSEERISCLDTEVPGGEGRVMDCVVCMVKEARITLPCDHRCLCNHCASRVFQQFGTCPLCRQEIRAPCVTGTL